MAEWRGIESRDGEDLVKSVVSDANTLTDYGDGLTLIIRHIDTAIGTMVWHGADRIAFENDWTARVKPELDQMVTLLRASAHRLTSLAVAQARVSGMAHG